MPRKRFRAAMNFPSLDAELQFQTVEVESNDWAASLAKIGRAAKKLEVTKRRRIRDFSLVVHEIREPAPVQEADGVPTQGQLHEAAPAVELPAPLPVAVPPAGPEPEPEPESAQPPQPAPEPPSVE